MTTPGLSDVFAERLSRSPTAASYELRMIIGWPSMLRYVSSPASKNDIRLRTRSIDYIPPTIFFSQFSQGRSKMPLRHVEQISYEG